MVRIGGLYRCCVDTAAEHGDGAEGDRLTCRYCQQETMVYRLGAWEWVGADATQSAHQHERPDACEPGISRRAFYPTRGKIA